ncbi:MAG TPA: BACON domain-containing protein [Vicinamibacterales bacterium]|nr:BACON domain-containing protein [Vicinamibacterales bacterium]
MPGHRVPVWPILLFVATVAACGFSGATQLAGPDATRCAVTLGGSNALAATQTQAALQVSTSRDCAWSAASNQSWLSVAPGNGQGDATVSLTAIANPASSARVAVVTVNNTGWTLTQSGAAAVTPAATPEGTTSPPPPAVGSPPASQPPPPQTGPAPAQPPNATPPASPPPNPGPATPPAGNGEDNGGNGNGGNGNSGNGNGGNGNGGNGQGNGNGNGNGTGNGNSGQGK